MTGPANEFIEFTVTADDWAAFGDHQARTLGTMRQGARRAQLFGSLFVAVIAIGLHLLQGSWFVTLVVILAGAYALREIPRTMRKVARKQMVKLYHEGKGPKARGLHRLEATPGGLAASTDISESLTRWDAIEGMTETPSHVFFDFGGGVGTAIPRQSVTAGNFDALMDRIRLYRHDARGMRDAAGQP